MKEIIQYITNTNERFKLPKDGVKTLYNGRWIYEDELEKIFPINLPLHKSNTLKL